MKLVIVMVRRIVVKVVIVMVKRIVVNSDRGVNSVSGVGGS